MGLIAEAAEPQVSLQLSVQEPQEPQDSHQGPQMSDNDLQKSSGAQKVSDNDQRKSAPLLHICKRVELLFAAVYAFSLPLSVTVSEVVFYIGMDFSLVSGLAGMFLNAQKSEPGRRSIFQAPLVLPLALFALAVTISGAVNAGSAAGNSAVQPLLAAWKSLYSLKTLLPYFWAFSIFQRNRAAAATPLVLMLWVSAIAGVWGSIQQIFNIHPGYKWLQGTGFHGHPMAYAGQMEIFSMLSLGLYFAGANKKLRQYSPQRSLTFLFSALENRLVFALIVAANFAGLFFAGEKSAWLGGFIGIVALCCLKSFSTAIKSFGLLSGLSLLSYFFVPLVHLRIDSMFSGHDPSISARVQIWQDCLMNYFPKSPLFGVGWLNFPSFAISDAVVPGISSSLNHAHSNFVHVLTTTGLLGFLCYVLLLAWTFKSAVSGFAAARKENNEFEGGLYMGIFAAAVAVSVAGIFEFNFGTAQVRLAQWFLFGLI